MQIDSADLTTNPSIVIMFRKIRIFLQRNSARDKIPLAIAAGGGGLGLGKFSAEYREQHGHGINKTRPPFTGNMYGMK